MGRVVVVVFVAAVARERVWVRDVRTRSMSVAEAGSGRRRIVRRGGRGRSQCSGCGLSNCYGQLADIP